MRCGLFVLLVTAVLGGGWLVARADWTGGSCTGCDTLPPSPTPTATATWTVTATPTLQLRCATYTPTPTDIYNRESGFRPARTPIVDGSYIGTDATDANNVGTKSLGTVGASNIDQTNDYPWTGTQTFSDLRLGHMAAAFPTCDESLRGQWVSIQGGAGVADKLCQCIRGASEVYGWVNLYDSGGCP